jgi:hypothetical protein
MNKTPFVRQSFLGPNSQRVLKNTKVAIIGLGGGGCYVSQELAHAGIGNFELFDYDRFSLSNLNRSMGATYAEVKARRRKAAVYADRIAAINPRARIVLHQKDWKSCAESLRDCDVVFGCVDSYLGRSEIEATCRRYLIPYIDIGMDVYALDQGHCIGGQIVVSLPGEPCLRCIGFLTEARLAEEASNYGAAGGRPQVVWSNGVLASAAVGIGIQLITPWHSARVPLFQEYDGNAHTLSASSVLGFYQGKKCTHFLDLSDLGDPFFK